jgi:hypothetical protein
MSSVKDRKREQLYRFCNANGLFVPTSEIANALGISTRSIFNRYQTLEMLRDDMMCCWYVHFKERLEEKFDSCNNEVEMILCFIHELQYSSQSEPDFFQRESKAKGFLISEHGFIEIVNSILHNGQKSELFREDKSFENYASFLLYNVIYYYISFSRKTDIISYLINPILTIEGHELLEAIDLVSFFEI